MKENTPIKIRVPKQHISDFSLFSTTEAGAQQWCESLPMANTAGLALQLVAAIDEFNHVILAPQARYLVLETLRPVIQQALSLLAARLTNQALILPRPQQQLADLVSQLAALTSTAYALVAIHAVQKSAGVDDVAPVRLVAEALQRGQYFGGYGIIHAYQLHQPLAPGAWSRLHQLYLLAERQQLTDLRVVGVQDTMTTIEATYLQPLVLSCCQPNQLRQQDIVAICESLDSWIRHVTLKPPAVGTGLFAIDLTGDLSPIYTSTVAKSTLAKHRLLDTAVLSEHLESLLQASRLAKLPSVIIGKNTRLSLPLLEHVAQSVGSERLRVMERSRTRQSLEVALGFRNCHFHIAGKRTFDELLQGNSEITGVRKPASGNLFLVDPDADDAWSVTVTRDIDRKTTEVAEPAGDGVVEFSGGTQAVPEDISGVAREFPIQPVTAIDASSGGYCLEWTSELPGRIGNGHVLGVRAAGTAEWKLATIRWIASRSQNTTTAGIEILSTSASPWGASVQRNTPEKLVPVRVFLLPAIDQPGHRETLVTPRSGFTEGQRVLLVRDGESRFVKLQKQIAMSAAFSQFEVITENRQQSDTASAQHTCGGIDFLSS